MRQYMKSVVGAVAILSSLVALRSLAPAVASAEGSVRSPALLAVFDAKGDMVGNVVGLATPVTPLQSVVVALKVGKRKTVFALQVFRDRFEGNVPTLLFESPTCSGTPLLISADQAKTLTPVVAVASPGSTVYLADPEATPRTITVGSEQAADGTCTTPTGPDGAPVTQANAVPALPVIDLNTRFTPPFSVR